MIGCPTEVVLIGIAADLGIVRELHGIPGVFKCQKGEPGDRGEKGERGDKGDLGHSVADDKVK